MKSVHALHVFTQCDAFQRSVSSAALSLFDTSSQPFHQTSSQFFRLCGLPASVFPLLFLSEAQFIVADDVIHASLPAVKDDRALNCRTGGRARSLCVWSGRQSISTCFVRGQARSGANQLLPRPTTVSATTTPTSATRSFFV